MTRTTLRRSTRRVLVGAGFGVALVLLGLLAGAGPAIGDQTIATTLAYTCQFPAGAQQVSVQFNATFPRTGQAGQPIAPTGVSVKLDVPQVALGNLTTIGAASVSTTGAFSVVRQDNGASTTLAWPGLAAPNAPLPSTGDLTITLAGSVPSNTVADSGQVTFAADAFGLIFTPLTSTSAATNPGTMSVACLLNANQTATLATVDVQDPPTTALSTTPDVPQSPVGQPNATTTTTTTTQPVDPNCKPLTIKPPPPIITNMVGRVNLNQLNESSPVGPGQVTLNLVGTILSPFTLCYSAQMALSPNTATVLGFGFMPITTTMAYTQVGPLFVEAATGTTTVRGAEDITVTTASINGVPLNVGNDCHTATPVKINLNSLPPPLKYNAINGGYLQGLVDIPQLTGCGVGEDLDALVSAPVAGIKNLLRMCQENSVKGQNPFLNCQAP